MRKPLSQRKVPRRRYRSRRTQGYSPGPRYSPVSLSLTEMIGGAIDHAELALWRVGDWEE